MEKIVDKEPYRIWDLFLHYLKRLILRQKIKLNAKL